MNKNMVKGLEKYGDYSATSSRILERMIRFASEGDFNAAFVRGIDLIKEDDIKFDKFLETDKMQEKIVLRIKNIAEIFQNQDKVNNILDVVYEIRNLLVNLKPETIEKYKIQDVIMRFKEFVEDQED